MLQVDVIAELSGFTELARAIDQQAPADGVVGSSLIGKIELRAQLSGLALIFVTSSWERCVRNILVEHADTIAADFSSYINRRFNRMNSRIRLPDLYKYTEEFDPSLKKKLKEKIQLRKNKIEKRTGINIIERYDNILEWRHDFAHENRMNTTIEEIKKDYNFANRVIYCFNEVFEERAKLGKQSEKSSLEQ